MVSVVLTANPSTGYRWQIQPTSSPSLVFVDREYVARDPELLGGGGHETFRFRPSSPGDATLRFANYPPGDSTPVESVQFTVLVE